MQFQVSFSFWKLSSSWDVLSLVGVLGYFFSSAVWWLGENAHNVVAERGFWAHTVVAERGSWVSRLIGTLHWAVTSMAPSLHTFHME